MNNSITSIYYNTFALLILLSFLLSATATLTPLLVQTCKKTNDDALCLSSLSSDPRTALAADVKSLALIELDTISVKTKIALDIVGKLFKHAGGGWEYRSLGTCINSYSGILQNRVPQAIAALNSRDYAGAKELLGDVDSDVKMCVLQYTVKQPFTDASQLVARLAAVTLGMVDLLH